jgi:hypothetical protein
LVLRVFERRPVGTFPARRARLFALREPLHDRGLQVTCRSTRRAGWPRFRPPHPISLPGRQAPGASAPGGPVLRARRLMPASPESARRRGALGPSPRLPGIIFNTVFGRRRTISLKNVYPKDNAKLEEQLRSLRTYRVELRGSELWVDLD